MSPIARSTNDTASTPTAEPRAARALAVSWAATAPTAANAAPAQAHDSPKAQAPRASSPAATRARAVSRPSRRLAPRVRISAATQRCPAADHPGAQELGAALLLVAAGVPDHGEEHEDRDQHGAEGGHLQHGDAAQVGRVVDAPVEGDQRGCGVHRLGGRPASRRGGVDPHRGRGRAGRHPGQDEQPDGQQDPVPAQDQPGHRPRAGQARRPRPRSVAARTRAPRPGCGPQGAPRSGSCLRRYAAQGPA